MKSSIFREYDIRGIVGTELILDEAYRLGRAIISFLQHKHPAAREIVIGRDGRSSSLQLQAAITQACLDHGINVIDIGLVPTPVLYFAVNYFSFPLGLVITASHNPKEYNGIKIWGVWGKEIQAIHRLYQKQEFKELSLEPASTRVLDAVTPYINYMKQQFSHLQGRAINAVVDCGNGTGGVVYPKLIRAMEWKQITVLCEEVDCNFPSHEADPTVPKNMKDVAQALAQNPSLTLGIGLDGDCDRMAPMTASGNLVFGDILLGIFAKDLLVTMPNAPIICDIKSSSALFEVLEKAKATYHLSPSGHSIIKEQMQKHQAVLAGELSCHFFFKDRYFGYDDGIYASIRLFELLHKHKTRLEHLVAQFPPRQSSREIRISCSSDSVKQTILKEAKQFFAARPSLDMITIDGVRVVQSYGWGLIRASNTQPALCLRFESSDRAGLNLIKNDFFKALQPHFDEATLNDYFNHAT